MSAHNDGGPAFPGKLPIYGEVADEFAYCGGMTLRDYFADSAPIDYRVALDCWGAYNPISIDDTTRASFFAMWATLRYEWADAMLAARGAA